MSTPLPTCMNAYIIPSRGFLFPFKVLLGNYSNQAELRTVPVPRPSPSEVLVKVEVFAANPVDNLQSDYLGSVKSVLGCDFVGTVASIGSQVSRHKIGDRVVGHVYGGHSSHYGAAAEYTTIEEDFCWPCPEGMDKYEAVSFGLAFHTAAMAIYGSKRVPILPATISGSPWLFVLGGSSSVGLFAIQLAKASGFQVIAAASPHSFELCKRYGADHVVDYHDHAVALMEIHKVTGSKVTSALDCIGGKPNARFAVDAIGTAGGHVASTLMGAKSHRTDVMFEEVLIYRYFGQAFTFIPIIASFPAEPEKRSLYADFCSRAPDFVKRYGLRGSPYDKGGDMSSIPIGWDKLRKKAVSGKKLVFDIASDD